MREGCVSVAEKLRVYSEFGQHHWRARAVTDQDAAFECWWAGYLEYRDKALRLYQPGSKQHTAALRSKDAVRELWMRRYKRCGAVEWIN